jgi:dTDP-4-dehydrorhamnose 3,5-epimerase
VDAIHTSIEGLVRLPLELHHDDRGWVGRVQDVDLSFPGIGDRPLVQQTALRSRQGVLRGFHFRTDFEEWKVLRIVAGEAFDVVVDLRERVRSGAVASYQTTLSGDSPELLVIPPGCAHGIQALSHQLDFTLTMTTAYDASKDTGFAWDDPECAVPWPIRPPVLSERDRFAPSLRDIEDSLTSWFGV